MRWRTAGACPLLAGALGYVRLAEPVRFRNDWEQRASLRLHDGDSTVLGEYDQHGRIAGGEPEQMMDAAAAAYVALAADGTDFPDRETFTAWVTSPEYGHRIRRSVRCDTQRQQPSMPAPNGAFCASTGR